jgi:hypothetical protein
MTCRKRERGREKRRERGRKKESETVVIFQNDHTKNAETARPAYSGRLFDFMSDFLFLFTVSRQGTYKRFIRIKRYR